jgi:two-component system sensor histidine kinase/response regulator
VIDDVLEMSKIESGHLSAELDDFQVSTLLDDVERMFRLQAQRKQLEFHLDVSPSVPAVLVSDQAKLRQVLINLVGNAIKFTERGSVRVHVTADCSSKNEITLSVAVSDTGPGIELSQQAQLFQPFVQVGRSSERTGGTGLGLAISKRLVELLGGTIELESELCRGSTFRFRIQATASRRANSLPAPAVQVESSNASHQAVTILIVDDQEANRRLLTLLLEPLGHPTIVAANGDDAIQQFTHHKASLILMDMRMPVMDGFEATRRIRALEGGRKARIVAITASAFDDENRDIRATGVDDVLLKPFRQEALIAIVEDQIRQLALLARGE